MNYTNIIFIFLALKNYSKVTGFLCLALVLKEIVWYYLEATLI